MYDIIIIGAGVTGCAVARYLSRYEGRMLVLEKAEDVCCGTSKANSAIVHAGFDAAHGSLMAKMNLEGNLMMPQLAKDLDFAFKMNGSLVVCMSEEDLPKLRALYENGVKNGVKELEIVDAKRLHELEPNVSKHAVAALWAPTGGIVCPFNLTIALAENAFDNGVEFQFNTEVTNVIFDINDGKKVDEYEVNSDITKRLIVQHDFDDFDLMEIEFTKTKEPFNRIVVDYFSFGDITDFTMERQDMTSSPKSIKQELVKAVRVPCYSYQKGTAEETLISEETEAVKGDIQTYYLGDPTYGCRATFNSSASNVSIIENGDYYVTVKFLITGKYQFEIIGHRYNIVEQYAVKTLNSRGKTITWKNPLVSDMETANHLADWLGDYYNAGIEYEYNTRGNPEIDANDIVYQENAYRPGLKVNIYRHIVNFSQSLSGKVIARRVSEK